MDADATIMSTTGSKGLQEAFCKHEDLLLSKLIESNRNFFDRKLIGFSFLFQLNCYATKIWMKHGLNH